MSAPAQSVARYGRMGRVFPLAEYFKLQALPPSYFPYLIAILVGYLVLTTAMKRLTVASLDGSSATLA